MKKTLDIVVYGAYGYTGTLVCEYLAARDEKSSSESKIRWGIAGRNQSKLDRLKADLVEQFPNATSVPIICTNTLGPSACTAQARLMLNMAGPYNLHADPVLQACIENKCHYVDLTGEIGFIRRVKKEYDAKAKEAGIAIINCAGFDCIPADLMTHYVADKYGKLQDRPNGELHRVCNYIEANGSVSTGTIKSIIDMSAHLSLTEEFCQLAYATYGGGNGLIASTIQHIGHFLGSIGNKSLKLWPHFNWKQKRIVIPMPTADPMIVRRSIEYQFDEKNNGSNAKGAVAQEGNVYPSPTLQIGHYLTLPLILTVLLLISLPLLWLFTIPLLVGAFFFFLAVKLSFVRKFFFWMIPTSAGPSAEKRASSWFTMTSYGYNKDGKCLVIAKMSGGCPGYGETSKMMTETGLAVLQREDQKAGSVPKGVVTTMTACGSLLRQRLSANGISFSIDI